jgi:hypothetical protein
MRKSKAQMRRSAKLTIATLVKKRPDNEFMTGVMGILIAEGLVEKVAQTWLSGWIRLPAVRSWQQIGSRQGASERLTS